MEGTKEEKKIIIPKRSDWHEHWMNQAKVVASRGTCLRRNFGAIIVSPDDDNVSLSQGYSGAPRGTDHCTDLGQCMRDKLQIPSGQRYELCRSVHAEQNAIINAARKGFEIPPGCKIYIYGFSVRDNAVCSGEPCKMCRRVIMNAGIKEVISTEKGGGMKHSLIADWRWDSKKNPMSDFEYPVTQT